MFIINSFLKCVLGFSKNVLKMLHLPAFARKECLKKPKFFGPKCWWLFSGKKFELLKLILGFSFWQSKFLLFQKLNFYIITITHMYCIWKKISSRNFSHISRRYILIYEISAAFLRQIKNAAKNIYTFDDSKFELF